MNLIYECNFRIINVYQCFFTVKILFDEVDRGLGHELDNCFRYHLYHFLLVMVILWNDTFPY